MASAVLFSMTIRASSGSCLNGFLLIWYPRLLNSISRTLPTNRNAVQPYPVGRNVLTGVSLYSTFTVRELYTRWKLPLSSAISFRYFLYATPFFTLWSTRTGNTAISWLFPGFAIRVSSAAPAALADS